MRKEYRPTSDSSQSKIFTVFFCFTLLCVVGDVAKDKVDQTQRRAVDRSG